MDIPVVQISAIPMIPVSVGTSRVVQGISVEHVCGEPELSPERDQRLQKHITMTALEALQTEVDKPTLFTPTEDYEQPKEAVHAT